MKYHAKRRIAPVNVHIEKKPTPPFHLSLRRKSKRDVQLAVDKNG